VFEGEKHAFDLMWSRVRVETIARRLQLDESMEERNKEEKHRLLTSCGLG
jgi:hypothetical protein